tara:strand:+ start:458 stop:628 length:171 start_codon:yes stop_codon:yes gene_type:complete
MKNFGIIFWIMIIIAGGLSVTTTYMIDSRMDEMESNIDEINSMLKDMTFVGNTPEG